MKKFSISYLKSMQLYFTHQLVPKSDEPRPWGGPWECTNVKNNNLKLGSLRCTLFALRFQEWRFFHSNSCLLKTNPTTATCCLFLWIEVCRGTDIHGRNASWGHQNPIFPDFLAFQLLVLNMIFCHFSPLFPAHECCHHATMSLKVILIITKCFDPNIFQERATHGHNQLIFSGFHMCILNWAFWPFFAPFCMLMSDPLTPPHL